MKKSVKRGIIIGSSTIVGLLLLCVITMVYTLEYFTSNGGKERITQIAEEYVVGDVQLEDVEYTFWSTMPRIGVALKNVMLVNEEDTIVTIKEAHAELNWWKLLSQRAIYINDFSLNDASANIHLYADSTLNIIIKTDTTNETDGTPPLIILRKGEAKNVHACYIDDLHNLEAMVDSLDLRITDLVKNPTKEKNVYVATPRAKFANKNLAADSIPIKLEGCIVASPRDRRFDIHEIHANVQSLQLDGNGTVLIEDKIETDLHWKIWVENLADIKNIHVQPVQEKIQHVYFDGKFLAEGDFDGVIGDSLIPSLVAKIEIDSGKMAYEDLPHQIDLLSLKANVVLDLDSITNSFAELGELKAYSGDSYLVAIGRADDLFGRCLVDADVDIFMDLNYLKDVFPQKYFTKASGKISSCIQGKFAVEDIVQHHLENVYSKAELHVDNVNLKAPKLDLDIVADSLNWTLGTNSIVGKKSGKVSLLASRLAFDKLSLEYKNVVKRCKASRFTFNCTANEIEDGVPQCRAILSANSMDGWIDTVKFFSKKTRASLTLGENPLDRLTPKADIRLTADSLIIDNPLGGVRLDSTTIWVSAIPRVRTHYHHSSKKNNEENTKDSLEWVKMQKNRVAVNLDSLVREFEWICKDSDQATSYLRQFKTTGNVVMKEASVHSVHLPLAVSAQRGNLIFSDDTLKLNNFHLKVGKSQMTLTGDMKNMRRAFLRGKTLEGRFNLDSPLVDLNELLFASNAWEKEVVTRKNTSSEVPAKDDYSGQVDINDKSKNDTTNLVVIPKILNVEFHANVSKLLFTDITLNHFNGDVMIKDQVMKIKNLSTTTSLGMAKMNVMYGCKEEESATIGVDLMTDDINVHELIRHIPVLDSIVPMLRSFEGNLDCEITATAQVDKNFKVKLPTVEAAARLYGINMTLLDGETFATIAKSLMFKNKKRNLIDSLAVEFTIKDNKMNVLPFILCMDKYKVAVSGNHNFDMSFNYHISVLKPVILGLNVYGNIDDIHYKLVERKYKNEKSVVSSCVVNGENIREQVQDNLRKTIQ